MAFTPGALLVVAVADFAYELYKDYHKGSSFTDEEFAVEFKNVARELAELEARGEVAPSLDVYARFRRDLREWRREPGAAMWLSATYAVLFGTWLLLDGGLQFEPLRHRSRLLRRVAELHVLPILGRSSSGGCRTRISWCVTG